MLQFGLFFVIAFLLLINGAESMRLWLWSTSDSTSTPIENSDVDTSSYLIVDVNMLPPNYLQELPPIENPSASRPRSRSNSLSNCQSSTNMEHQALCETAETAETVIVINTQAEALTVVHDDQFPDPVHLQESACAFDNDKEYYSMGELMATVTHLMCQRALVEAMELSATLRVLCELKNELMSSEK